jgi:uncharacterized protein YukE
MDWFVVPSRAVANAPIGVISLPSDPPSGPPEAGRSKGLETMAQAVVDPAELRRFAQNLRHFNTELHNRMAVIHGQLSGLSQTWRDKEQEKFTEEFEATLIVINRFIEATNAFVPFLLRKAERVEEYLQQR